MVKKNDNVGVIANNYFISMSLFLFAFWLRCNWYFFSSSDAVIHQTFAFRLLHTSIFDLNIRDNFFSELISYPYGFGIIFIYIQLWICKFLSLPYTEFIATLPLIFIASLHIVVIYFLIIELYKNKSMALFVSLFLALSHVHIRFSHWMPSLHQLVPSLMMLCAFLFALRFHSNKNTINAYLFYFFLAFCIISSVMYLGVLAVFFRMFFLDYKKYKELIFNKSIILFFLIITPYIVSYLYYGLFLDDFSLGLFGKIFSKESDKVISFSRWIEFFLVNISPLKLCLFFVSSIFFMFNYSKNRDNFLWIWALVFSLPFLLFGSEESVGSSIYIFESMIPYTIMTACFLFYMINQYIFKKLRNLLLYAIIMFLFLCRPYLHDSFLNSDIGAKASGFIVREYISDDIPVFTDMGPMLFEYYSNHFNVYNLYNASVERHYNFMVSIIDKVDCLIISEDLNQYILRKDKDLLNEFLLAYQINNQNNPVRIIFLREKQKVFNKKIMLLDQLNKNFDDKYSYIDQIFPDLVEWPIMEKISY